jgi:hypothetical protein
LRHEHDWCLNCRKHRQEQVEQDVRIRVEALSDARQQHRVQDYPSKQNSDEQRNKGPRPAETRHGVGSPLTEGHRLIVLNRHVARHRATAGGFTNHVLAARV